LSGLTTSFPACHSDDPSINRSMLLVARTGGQYQPEFPVDVHEPRRRDAVPVHQAEQETGHLVVAADDIDRCARLSSAVPGHRHLGMQHGQHSGHIRCGQRHKQLFDQPLRDGVVAPRGWIRVGHAATSPGCVLSGGGFRTAQRLGDIGVGHSERIVQDEGAALLRGQRVQHHQQGHPQVGGMDDDIQRISCTADHRLRQPLADITLAAGRGRPELVHADSPHDGRQLGA